MPERPGLNPVEPAPAMAHAGTEVAGLRRILRNSAALLAAYLVPRLATFAAVVVAARVVGVARFGAYGTAAALAVILSIAATLGMMQMLVRDLAQSPTDAPRLLAAANVAKAGTVLFMLAALWVVATLGLGYPRDVVSAAMLLGISYAIGGFAENLGAYFQSRERMGVWMQAQAAFGIVSGAVGIALVLATRSIVWFCAAPAVGQLAAMAWLLYRAPPALRGAWTAPWPDVRRLLRSLLPFAAAFVALTAYYKVDILLVERWRGAGEAGLYAAAYKFVDVAQALALVAATALYPRFARDAGRAPGSAAHPAITAPPHGSERDPRHSPMATARVIELLLLAAVPAAGLLWLLREPTIVLLYGGGYRAAAPVLDLLAPVLPMLALNVVGTFVLAARRRMRAVGALYGAALLLNLVLNAVLIPTLGGRGAALAMLLSETALAGGMLMALRRHTASALGARAMATALAAAAVVPLLALVDLPLAAAATGYVVVVALLYWRARAVTGHEAALFWRAIQP